jgi:hypothetical protein
MGYRIAGRCTDLCSCHTPCPCAFGQTPTGGTCAGMFCFDIQEGQYENVDLGGTRAIFADVFSGPWMDGNFTAALILDANSSQEQRDALTDIFTGKAGGDGADTMALVGDMKGVLVAPIDYEMTANGEITVRAGALAEAGRGVLSGLDGTSEITVTNPLYPLPTVIAGKSTRSRVSVPGLEFDNHGSGMWTGPFELHG